MFYFICSDLFFFCDHREDCKKFIINGEFTLAMPGISKTAFVPTILKKSPNLHNFFVIKGVGERT
jgi:hypothetical protein